MPNHYRLALTLLISVVSLALSPAQEKQLAVKLTIEGRKEHPIVYLTRQDIARARENREKYDWAKKAAETLLKEADEWATKSDEELIALVPPPESCYAYGFSGCPVCGGSMMSWWGMGGVASLDDPRHVRCVNGHRLPDEGHPDAGEGYTDANRRAYYFVGTYNSFVIDTLTKATTKLVHAYALTGDAKYAAKGALILDHLARIYPTSEKGSWDYPSHPPSGRFNRPWYQVARTLVFYVNQYDILMSNDELARPSSVKGITRRQNIEQNMLLNGAAYCYRQSVIQPALHNGQADYIRGPMAVGAAMGIRQYIEWGVDGPYGIRAMIANNVDRDGQYYETSAGYSDHARSLYMDMAQIARNWTDEKYPQGINLSLDPVFVMFNRLPRTRLRCATLPPSLGDDAPHVKRVPTTQPIDALDVAKLEMLAALGDGDFPDLTGEMRDESLIDEWLLFHARTPTTARSGNFGKAAEQSDLFSQKGLAILRSGAGEHARAATLRFGPTLNHGHFDEMNLNIYARGYEMSYDLGYGLGSTHTQVGWAHTTASHNTVVVDETPQLRDGRSGGTLKYFTPAAGVSVVRADDTNCYTAQGLTRYERTVAMIDVSDELSYIVDIFHVVGGSKHDYVFHGMGTDLTTANLQLGEPATGSLAGKDVNWGERIGSDGNVIGIEGKEYWNPPPANGYGFLVKPRSGKATGEVWSATWEIDQEAPARMRLNMLAMPDTQIVACEAPGIYPKFPRSAYVLARRAGRNLDSRFAAVIEPYGQQRAIKAIRQTPAAVDGGIAIQIDLTDGRTDTVAWSPTGDFTLKRSDGMSVRIRPDGVAGEIEKIDYDNNILFVRSDHWPDGNFAGKFVYVSNPAYAQESAYRIASAAAENGLITIRLAPTRLILNRGHLDASPTNGQVLPNVIPLEYAKSLARKPSGFLRGKRIAAPCDSAVTTIVGTDARGMALTVKDTKAFKAGDDLTIYDVQAGDHIRIPSVEHTLPSDQK